MTSLSASFRRESASSATYFRISPRFPAHVRHSSTSNTTLQHHACAFPPPFNVINDDCTYSTTIDPFTDTKSYVFSITRLSTSQRLRIVSYHNLEKSIMGGCLFLAMHYFGLDPGEYRHGVSLRLSMIPNLLAMLLLLISDN